MYIGTLPEVIHETPYESWFKPTLDKVPLTNSQKAILGTAADIGMGRVAATAGSMIGMALGGPFTASLLALPGIIYELNTYWETGADIARSADTGKRFGEGRYFDSSSNAKKVLSIAQNIEKNPPSYAASKMDTLEKMKRKWSLKASNTKNSKEKTLLSKFVKAIDGVIDGAKNRIKMGKK